MTGLRRHLTAGLLLAACALAAQTPTPSDPGPQRPQETRPGPTPTEQQAIIDSIRNAQRVRFHRDDDEEAGMRYTADRALLMPRMERSSIFRIGLPGWLMRLGLRFTRDEFDTEEEYLATRSLLKRIRGLRVAAFARNPAYDQQRLRRDYERYVRRRRADPVLVVRAPEGGVQIHVRERRGRVRLISLVAYGAEGAAVVRLKTRLREGDVRRALNFLTETAAEEAGITIDADQ